MTKAELVAAVAEKADVTKKTAEDVIGVAFDVMQDALSKGQDVKIPGFGTFEVRDRAARKGRNPQTKEEIDIPASKHVAFRAGKSLKDAIKAG